MSTPSPIPSIFVSICASCPRAKACAKKVKTKHPREQRKCFKAMAKWQDSQRRKKLKEAKTTKSCLSSSLPLDQIELKNLLELRNRIQEEIDKRLLDSVSH